MILNNNACEQTLLLNKEKSLQRKPLNEIEPEKMKKKSLMCSEKKG